MCTDLGIVWIGVETELYNSVFITHNPKKVGLTKKVYLEKFLSVVSITQSSKIWVWMMKTENIFFYIYKLWNMSYSSKVVKKSNL